MPFKASQPTILKVRLLVTSKDKDLLGVVIHAVINKSTVTKL